MEFRSTDSNETNWQSAAVKKHISHFPWFKRINKLVLFLHIVVIIITIFLYFNKGSESGKQISTLVSMLLQIATFGLTIYLHTTTNKLLQKVHIE